MKEGSLVTYRNPEGEVEKAFIGVVIGHFPDATPPRTTVRWENSGYRIAPIITLNPSEWRML